MEPINTFIFHSKRKILKIVNFLGFVLTMVLMASPTLAYNRATHQHINEVAYAYLKAMGVCQPHADELFLTRSANTNCVKSCQKQGNGEKLKFIKFEELKSDIKYIVGDRFSDSEVEMSVQSFELGNGNITEKGSVQVSTRKRAEGEGNELAFMNANVKFGFSETLSFLTFRFKWSGGNLNIDINGDSRNIRSFSEITGQAVGGVAVTLLPGSNPEKGILKLEGALHSFSIGGQEFWVDDVSANIPSGKGDIWACQTKCFLAVHMTFPGCEAMAGILASPHISVEDAEHTVQFFQNFQATACPPTSYQYEDEDGCSAGPTAERMNTQVQELQRWERAALEMQTTAEGYVPVVGGLLGSTNWVEVDGELKTDLTGTIVGYRSGAVDLFLDTYGEFRAVPVVEDGLKTFVEILAGGTGGSLASLVGLGTIIGCALSCPITIFTGHCDDCFRGGFNAAKDILNKTLDFINDIEETSFFSVSRFSEFMGNNLTSTYHLNSSAPGDFDDIDGWRPKEAFGPGLALADLAFKLLLKDIAWGMRIYYPRSRRPLMNYQMQNSDDGRTDSVHRGVFYWHRNRFLDYAFPPVDNVTYYWWHKWLEGRINNRVEGSEGNPAQYGLMPLGGVLHGIQDITQPFHAWGITLQGHAPAEDRIAAVLFPQPSPAGEINVPDSELLINLNNQEDEQAFLDRIGQFIDQIYREVIIPDGGILNIRNLVHFLRDQVVNAPTNISLSSDMALLSWWDYNVEESFTEEVGIPLAVAANVVVLVEAAKEDLNAYQNELRLNLPDFEHKGPVPPVRSSSTPGSDPPLTTKEIPRGFDQEYPEWVCATNQPRTQDALKKYANNDMSGRDMIKIIFAEKFRCDVSAMGLPVPDQGIIDQWGTYEAARLEASLMFYSHGSLPRMEKELACNQVANGSDTLTQKQKDHFKAVCDQTLDSDNDGVPDHKDQCRTPKALLDKGMAVKDNGCVFQHETFPKAVVNPFDPGTIRTKKP